MIFYNWFSALSMRLYSPHFSSACSGNEPPGMVLSGAYCWEHCWQPFFTGLPFQKAIRAAGWVGLSMTFHSAMGQAFAVATVAWVGCFIITIVVSLFTSPKEESELVGLVYSLTPRLKDAKSPIAIAILMIILGIILNLIFF